MNIAGAFKPIVKYVSKHAPTILIGLGVGGLVSAGVMVGVTTPKYLKAVEQKKEEKGSDLTFKEKASTAIKYYTPAVAMTGASAACIVAGTVQNAKRNAALAAGYKLAEESVRDYKRCIEEQFGEKKAKEVENKVVQKSVENHPQTETNLIVTENGNTKFYDPFNHRYFNGNIDKMKTICHKLTNDLFLGEDICLNDFWYEADLPDTQLSKYFGWKSEDMILSKRTIEFKPYPCLDEQGLPCVGIGFSTEPDYIY